MIAIHFLPGVLKNPDHNLFLDCFRDGGNEMAKKRVFNKFDLNDKKTPLQDRNIFHAFTNSGPDVFTHRGPHITLVSFLLFSMFSGIEVASVGLIQKPID